MKWLDIYLLSYVSLALHDILLLSPIEPIFLGKKNTKLAQNEVFQVLLKSDVWNFSVFCIKLQQRKTFKLTKMISRGKIWLKGFWVKMSSKWKFYEKVALTIFLFFLHKITIAFMLKINVLYFFWEKSCFEVFEVLMVSKINTWNISEFLHKARMA